MLSFPSFRLILVGGAVSPERGSKLAPGLLGWLGTYFNFTLRRPPRSIKAAKVNLAAFSLFAS